MPSGGILLVFLCYRSAVTAEDVFPITRVISGTYPWVLRVAVALDFVSSPARS